MPVAELIRTGSVPSQRDLSGIRILAVMPSIPVLGMERANLQIMKMMLDRGADVLFVVNAAPGQKVSTEVERMGMRWAAVPVTERPRLPRSPGDVVSMTKAWLTAARGIARVHREFRPTHVHVTGVGFVWVVAPTLWRTRAVVVMRQPNVADRNFPRSKQRVHDFVWRRLVAPLCDVIVCNSRCSYDRLREMRLPESKLSLIHNCVADSGPAQRTTAPRTEARPFTVVFVGQLAAPKGIEVLLEAASTLVRQHDGLTFHLVGWLSPYAQGLANRIQVDGLADRIRFMGERDQPGELLAAADLHVCPSLCEDSFPNTVLEAKSHGIPSVVFPSGGLPELVTHLVDGYVCAAKTADALRDGILHFARDRERLCRAGDAARQSLSRFAPEPIAAQWVELFRPRHSSHV